MRLFCALLPALAALAQQPTCSVEGQVFNAATGEPLRKVQILLRPAASSAQAPYAALSNAEGRFAIGGIPAGRYLLMASRANFVRPEFEGHARGRGSATLALSPGQRLQEVTVRLTPHGVIAGHVLDEDGDPVPNAAVHALRRGYVQGRRTLLPSASSTTNDLGEYRLAGLAPGRYYVSAAHRPVPAALMAPPEQGHATTYYPNTVDAAAAAALPVFAGNTLRGIEITLLTARTVSVSGRVTTPAGIASRNVQVFLSPRGTLRRESQNARVQPEGSFEVRGVTPGSYTVAAHLYLDGKRYTASLPVEVGGADIEGIELEMASGVEIAGRVRVEGDGELRAPGLRVVLQAVGDAPLTASMGGLVQEDGSFALTGIDPGPAAVHVFGLPENHYVKSVRLGENEWTEGTVTVSAGAGPLDVLLCGKAGQVEGVVLDDKQQPAPGATVVLAPDERRRSRLDLFRTTAADQYGRFVIKGIAPGDYKLFGWAEIEHGAVQDPEFLKAYERFGEPVAVGENGRETAQLKLLRAEQP